MHDGHQNGTIRHETGSGIIRRLLRGFGAQGLVQGVQLFVRLAEVPLLLSCWGAQLYGEWLMLSAIPLCLSVCDGGFTGATCRKDQKEVEEQLVGERSLTNRR
jgi:hypothetical protein